MAKKFYAARLSDFGVAYPFPKGTDLTGFEALVNVYDGLGGDVLLTFSTTPSANGSVVSFAENLAAFTVTKEDVDLLPIASEETDVNILWFDFIVTNLVGERDKLDGGTFIVQPEGATPKPSTNNLKVTLGALDYNVIVTFDPGVAAAAVTATTAAAAALVSEDNAGNAAAAAANSATASGNSATAAASSAAFAEEQSISANKGADNARDYADIAAQAAVDALTVVADIGNTPVTINEGVYAARPAIIGRANATFDVEDYYPTSTGYGVNHDAALTNAITALNANGSGRLLCRRPLSNLSTAQIVTATRVEMSFSRSGALTKTSTANSLFTFSGQHIVVDSPFFIGSGTHTAGYFLVMSPLGQYEINNVVSYGGYSLMYLDGAEVMVTGCKGYAMAADMIRFSPNFAGAAHISHCHGAVAPSNLNQGHGIYGTGGDTLVLEDISMTSYKIPVRIEPAAGTFMRNVNMTDVYADGYGRTDHSVAMLINGTNIGAELVRVRGVNTWASASSGPGMKVQGLTSGVFTNHYGLANGYHGVDLEGSPNPQYVIFRDAILSGNGQATPNTYCDLYASDFTSDFHVEGGIFGFTPDLALLGLTNRAKRPIHIAGTTHDHYTVAPSRVIDGVSGGGLDEGTGTNKYVAFGISAMQGHLRGDVAQSLTSTQQLQAISNAGIGTYFPRVDSAQSFTSTEKLQAISNIGIGTYFPRVDANQSFTATQQLQVLSNIGISGITPYTPTFVSEAGSFTAGSCVGSYQIIANAVIGSFSGTVTTAGTATGEPRIGLPFAIRSATEVVGTWTEQGSTAKGGKFFGAPGDSFVRLRNIDGTTTGLWANGYRFAGTFCYFK